MSAGRANHHLEPPPQPTTSSATHTTAQKPPPPQNPPQPQPVKLQLPPRDALPELPQVGSDAAWVIVKIVLRSLCLMLGLLLAGFALAAFARPSSSDGDGGAAYRVAVVSLPVGLLAAVWNGAEFVTMCARRSRRRGITAKAHVGLELLLWILGVAGSVAQALWSQATYGASGAAAISFLAVLGTLEFVLFVRSCLEVDRRKKDWRIQQLVIALQMQQQQQHQQQGQGQIPQQYHNNISSSMAESATWGPAAPSTSDYDRELNTKYQGPIPEPLYDPRDLQKVLIVDPRLRGIVD
ncbi:hypothetical protein PG994_003095 [Apiospora phragmitis]|uniref:Uncharacterized protein n=1 Tax=Apiospora phragmitis TaxID=2905665 RepID=A0ABR1W720_9PEZI